MRSSTYCPRVWAASSNEEIVIILYFGPRVHIYLIGTSLGAYWTLETFFLWENRTCFKYSKKEE